MSNHIFRDSFNKEASYNDGNIRGVSVSFISSVQATAGVKLSFPIDQMEPICA